MKIHKDDKVLITKGKYRGKTGNVLRVIPKENRIVVEGVNIAKKHTKPQKSGEKGKISEVPSPIYAFNVKLICKKCKKAVKVSYKIIERENKKKKIRICKKCGKET